MPVEVAMFQLDAGARWRLGIEAYLDLAGTRLVSLDRPLRADVPAKNHPVRRVERQNSRPSALGAVRCTVHDAAADPWLEYGLGERRAQHVVLGRFEVSEPVSEHGKGALDRGVYDHVPTDSRQVRLAH